MTPPPADPNAMRSLQGLAHPLRVQILNDLSAYGPSTASALAAKLGESSGATSYHLRQLARHGFVVEDTERGNARERWWKRAPGSIELSVADEASPAEQAAGEMILAEWMQNRISRLQAFMRGAKAQLTPRWLDASRLTTSNMRLTAEQAIALHDELLEVLDRYVELYREQDVPGSRPYQVHVDAFALLDGTERAADDELTDTTTQEPTS